MLAICIATKHIQLGATARFLTAQHLANQLGRSTSSLGRQRLLRPLLACDVLVLDELGYLPTLPGFGPALYELIAGRYERRPTLITSNKSLTEWAAIVQDASLAAALVDRILHHGEVFYLKDPHGESKAAVLMAIWHHRQLPPAMAPTHQATLSTALVERRP